MESIIPVMSQALIDLLDGVARGISLGLGFLVVIHFLKPVVRVKLEESNIKLVIKSLDSTGVPSEEDGNFWS